MLLTKESEMGAICHHLEYNQNIYADGKGRFGRSLHTLYGKHSLKMFHDSMILYVRKLT